MTHSSPKMRICFYNPFKPLGHSHPSGDLIIARSLFDYLQQKGHQIKLISDYRARWVFWRPWMWPRLLLERKRALRHLTKNPCDLWFTYHSYYKAPDLLGPFVAKRLQVPYVIFQGIYATKRSKKVRTWPGFALNRRSLCSARFIFTNKQVDLLNLRRLIPRERIGFVSPGIDPAAFAHDADARSELRRRWQAGRDPVILSAAMFRPDVKTAGLMQVLRTCGALARQGFRFQLVIAGDGREREKLERLARQQVPDRVRFLGKLSAREMTRFYSAGDLFVFPGIGESLGMVFLEAQSCGLPVVAYANGGVPEVVRDGETGHLVPLGDEAGYARAVASLLTDPDRRHQMGRAAADYVRRYHDLSVNYRRMEQILRGLVK